MTATAPIGRQLPERPRPGGQASAWAAIVVAELRLRWRDPGTMALLVVLAALTQLLTPGIDAPYATISVLGAKPVMSAETRLVAVAVVLGSVLLPLYLLILGLGIQRDIDQGLAPLHNAAPIPAGTLNVARLTARAVIVSVDLALLLALILVSSAMRFDEMPVWRTIEVFGLLLLPVAMAALAASAVIDRYVRSSAWRLTAAGLLWLGVILGAVFGGPDLLGYSLLRHNLAPNHEVAPISVGLTPSAGLRRLDWNKLLLPRHWLAERSGDLLAATAATLVVGMLAGKSSAHMPRRGAAARPWRDIAAAWPTRRPVSQAAGRGAGPIATARLVGQRWLKRRRYAWLLPLSALACAILDRPVDAIAVAALFPLLLFASRAHAMETGAFAMVIPALWRPTPNLLNVVIVALPTCLPLAVTVLTAGALQALYLGLVAIAGVAWLTLSCLVWRRTQLGVALYSLAWYGLIANAALTSTNLLRLGQAPPFALLAAGIVAGLLCALIATADRRYR